MSTSSANPRHALVRLLIVEMIVQALASYMFVHRVLSRCSMERGESERAALALSAGRPIPALLCRRYAFLRSGVTFSSALDGSQ